MRGDEVISYGVLGLPGHERVEIFRVGPSDWKITCNHNTREKTYDSPDTALEALKAEMGLTDQK